MNSKESHVMEHIDATETHRVWLLKKKRERAKADAEQTRRLFGIFDGILLLGVFITLWRFFLL